MQQKIQKNDFPLRNESARCSQHTQANSILNENSLLINPTEEDPSRYIFFKEEVPVAIGGNLKGSISIKSYGLERLNDARLENIKAIKLALTLVELDETNAAEIAQAAINLKIMPTDLVESVIDAKNLFNSAAKDTAKFAYCVRCKFPHLPTT